MAGTGDLDANAVLSDVEDDGGDPFPTATKLPSPEDVSVEKFREARSASKAPPRSHSRA